MILGAAFFIEGGSFVSRREEREAEIRTSESVRCAPLAGSRIWFHVCYVAIAIPVLSLARGLRRYGLKPLNDVGFEKARESGRLGEPSSGVREGKCARLDERLRTSRESFHPNGELSLVGWESVKKALRRLSSPVEHPARDAEMFGGQGLIAV